VSVSESISGLKATWSLLWGQKLGRSVVLVFSAMLAVHLLELGPESLRVALTRNLDRIVLPVMIVILFVRTRAVGRLEERRFWRLILAAFVLWFSGNAVWFLSYDFELPRWVGLSVDGLYILNYLCLFLASDQQPHLRSGWSSGDIHYRFSLIGATAFVALMFGYFMMVPWAAQSSEQHQYFASFNLYVTLDALLILKFALRFFTTHSARWRRAFALIAAAMAVLALGDLLEGIGLAGIFETVEGGRVDAVWLFPHFFLLAMILTCTVPPAETDKGEAGALSSIQSLLPFYTFSLPLVHLGLNLLDYLSPDLRTPREAIVFLGLIFFGVLSFAQQIRLERAVASLRSDLTVRALGDKLRQSQRLESIGRLAGGIAHDFNNLLMVITSYTELARAKVSGADDQVRKSLLEIDHASSRAAELVRQLLAFGGRQELRPKVVHVNGMVMSLEGMLSRVIGDNVELAVDLDCEVRYTKIDPTLLEQVIVNLIVNARDAMPQGGKVSIQTRLRCRLTGSLESPDDASEVSWLELCVSDTGEGIDPAVRERIFEPYFTTKEMEKGTGLGLATVYGIVEQSGGDIDVESAPGQGTTFRVWLPHVLEGDARTAKMPLGPGGSVSGKTLLLAEDEADIREAIAEYLESLGLTVLQAEDGVDALDVVSNHEKRIDVLLTDLVMPRMSGPELAERLLAERPDLKVIFVSGYTPETMSDYGINQETTFFLQKPFLLSQLSATISEVVEE